MVYISKQAYIDIDLIFIGMLEWNKSELSLEFVDNYIDDIIDECYKLCDLSFHFDSKYASHKYFGSKIHRYRRNDRTMWYVIYDLDKDGNVFVNKIISNHLTKQ